MRRAPYILLSFIACLAACRKIDLPAENVGIRLSAAIEHHNSTRAPYTYTPTPGSEHTWMKAAVYASTNTVGYDNTGTNSSGEFTGKVIYNHTGANGDNNSEGKVLIHSKINIQNTTDQLMMDAIYPIDARKVFFVGMHPETLEEGQTLWNYNEENNTVTHTFAGNTDVMFAPQTIGRYQQSPAPKLYFHHLLTWLRIEMVAESEDARDAWGEIESMTIQSPSIVTIDLGQGGSYDRHTHAEFTNGTNMNLFYTEITDGARNDKIFPTDLEGGKYTLKGPKVGNESTWENFVEEVAYVMCAPVTATTDNKAEYTLSIETANRGTMKVPINLMAADNATDFSGNTLGHQFTILLKFKIGENISVSARTTRWATGGVTSGEVEE